MYSFGVSSVQYLSSISYTLKEFTTCSSVQVCVAKKDPVSSNSELSLACRQGPHRIHGKLVHVVELCLSLAWVFGCDPSSQTVWMLEAIPFSSDGVPSVLNPKP